jgi:hypothetical protein
VTQQACNLSFTVWVPKFRFAPSPIEEPHLHWCATSARHPTALLSDLLRRGLFRA